jgi:hypothetical protein
VMKVWRNTSQERTAQELSAQGYDDIPAEAPVAEAEPPEMTEAEWRKDQKWAAADYHYDRVHDK